MKRNFIVSVEIPEGVSIEEMEEYIEESVAVWHGSKDPESAIYDLDGRTVSCHAANRKKESVK